MEHVSKPEVRNLAFRGAVESLLGVPVSDLVTPLSAWIVIGVIILVLIVSDIIPAQMFARIPISSAFRGYKESKRRRKISLLAFQFAINAVLVSLVLIVSFQYRKVLAADLAYVLPFFRRPAIMLCFPEMTASFSTSLTNMAPQKVSVI